MVIFHPDLLRKHPLGIAGYGLLSYQVHEALHLSASEELMLDDLLHSFEKEYEQPVTAPAV